MSHLDPDTSPLAPDPADEPVSSDAAGEQSDVFLSSDAPIGDGDNAIGATPPGFDWPTHGGYLGCLIGCLAAFLIGGFVGSVLLGALYVVGGGTAIAMAVVALAIYAGVTYGLCRLGWTLGKRYYRSYQASGETTWGEHDDFDVSPEPMREGESGARELAADDGTETDDEPSDARAAADTEDATTGLPLSSEGRRG